MAEGEILGYIERHYFIFTAQGSELDADNAAILCILYDDLIYSASFA